MSTTTAPAHVDDYAVRNAAARDAARARVTAGLTIGHTAPDPSLILRSTDVTVTYDRMGREVIVVPDVLAAYMTDELAEGWTPGVSAAGGGYSRRFTPFVHMFHVAAGLMDIYAASPVPDVFVGRDREYAEQSRDHAARGWSLHPFVVGASGWDAAARWWTDYDGTRHLHPAGTPHHRPRGGINAYVWEG